MQSAGSLPVTDELPSGRSNSKPVSGSVREPNVPTGAAYESVTLLELMKRQAVIRLSKDGAHSGHEVDELTHTNVGSLTSDENSRAAAAGNRLRNRLMRTDGLPTYEDLKTDALPLGIWNRMQAADSAAAAGAAATRADTSGTDGKSGAQQRVRFSQAAGAGAKLSSGPSSATSEADSASLSQRRQSMTFVNRIERELAIAAGSSDVPLASSDFTKQLLVYTPTPRTQASKDVQALAKCLVVGGIDTVAASGGASDLKRMSRSEANLAAGSSTNHQSARDSHLHEREDRIAIEQRPLEIPVNNLRVRQQQQVLGNCNLPANNNQ